MIWLPRTTDNSTYFAQSLEIRGIESRLYIGSGHFFRFKILNFNHFWGFIRINTFGYEDFVDNSWGVITKLDYI